jgi:hypothetical protein
MSVPLTSSREVQLRVTVSCQTEYLHPRWRGKGGRIEKMDCEDRQSFCLLLGVSTMNGGPGSSLGIATGYGLDGPGIESRWGRDFPYLSRSALGPTQPPVQWVPGLSRG